MLRGSSVSVGPRSRAVHGLFGVLALVAVLTSCTDMPHGSSTAPRTSSAASSTPPSVMPQPSSSSPALVPDGTAADNLPVFTVVTAQVWASDQRVHGRAYIDALVGAGFDRSRMQVTSDETTIGRAAESIQFSIAWGEDQCLIGQVGPSTGDPVTVVMPQLQGGRCLVGITREIDW
ncbi:hypothetical protein QF046_000321 [Microbacterium sp. W4I4]|uniref:DUF6993 domain-containing protein n=1 Tax=Microbacterium sp. W4I4 TaxID=3042295 RepID=UPI00277DBA37|nr:hypothetical protein [Microbacterium sp. W4I4]MDQ0612680.1 hypothetical protein [Microbacterium sp. W4I4]